MLSNMLYLKQTLPRMQQ